MANKKRLAEYETVALTKECSSRILKVKLLIKSFNVQVTLGSSLNTWRLYYLGASINLMPRKLGLIGPKPITILLQLANCLVAKLDEII